MYIIKLNLQKCQHRLLLLIMYRHHRKHIYIIGLWLGNKILLKLKTRFHDDFNGIKMFIINMLVFFIFYIYIYIIFGIAKIDIKNHSKRLWKKFRRKLNVCWRDHMPCASFMINITLKMRNRQKKNVIRKIKL